MKSGRVHVFRYEVGGPKYLVDFWIAADDAVESGDDSALAKSGDESQQAGANYDLQLSDKSLPEGITFFLGETKSDARGSRVEAELANAAGEQMSPPVLFYSDGTASTAQVVLVNERGRAVTVSLRGLTGIGAGERRLHAGRRHAVMGNEKVGRNCISSIVRPIFNRPRTKCNFVLRAQPALSLLEVILALAILALSMAAIGELLRMGNRSARKAQLSTRAQILCESILSQVVCGALPPSPVTRAPVVTDPDWYYTTELASTEVQGVMLLAVTVETQIELARPPGFTLVRWIPDPGIQLPDEPVGPSGTGTNSTSGNTTAAGGSPGGNSGGGNNTAGGGNNSGNNNAGGTGGGRNNNGGSSPPRNIPGNIPGNLPGKIPGNIPGNLPGNLPADVPKDLLNRVR